ncbi:YkvA family protein [Deinococcus yavapaiensis]|uniref:Uncharacterized protein DUF1232 n=1 Tax=Deinococcus yavapaiensis KR-236 TaxID=694435 RepID=A0A318S999_9DEIO|nr:YkvA family protein [Deinococcus yavapaiensis]PYE55710.1 uncharacterized protein DUF1232 [Deinococcus yavapaiensis KR-236]
MIAKLKTAARLLKRDVLALSIAARDPRTPAHAKLFALFVVAYALSPIDLIPDFIPVLGYLDDVILVPLGLWLALRMIPGDVMTDARAKAATMTRRGKSVVGALIVVLLWGVLVAVAWWAWSNHAKSPSAIVPIHTSGAVT